MRQDTKKKLFAVFIIVTFAMSSLAFVATIFTGGGLPPQQEFKPLESFVVEGPLNPQIEDKYVRAGFTSLKFYYNDDSLLSFVEQLPYLSRTNADQQQLIVQKIPGNETYISIVALNGAEEVRSVSKETIMEAVCRLLTVTPLECVALNATG